MKTNNKTLPNFEHQGDAKKLAVQKMFDKIASTYDFLNHVLSLGIDIYWRKRFLKSMPIDNNQIILDVACGTGDIGFEILKSKNIQLINLDLSINMLNIAKDKALKKKYDDIKFIHGDATSLPLENESVNHITIAYGFRNIANYDKALTEFLRVLKPGGTLGILEFSKPKSKLIKFIFRLYFHYILPLIGNVLTQSNAYSYLPESVDFFPTKNNICKKIMYSGFHTCQYTDLTLGISTIYIAKKYVNKEK